MKQQRRIWWWAACVGLAMVSALPAAEAVTHSGICKVIADTEPKMVKIFGAGGLRGLEAYQSAFLVSPDGYLLTAWSYVLDTDYITAILNDGRKYQAKLVGADPRLDVAVLKIEATDLPCFDLKKAAPAAAGTRILAFSNTFAVAQGDEPETVQDGVISVVTQLSARRGVFETPYHGQVYVLDAVTNNPGSAGGALVNRRGELVAMLGKELRNTLNNTWLNYAMPIAELRQSVEDIRAGKFIARAAETTEKKPEKSLSLAGLGITLVPDVLERTPPFVDGVRPASPAERGGLQPDDLVVLVGDRLVQSCKNLASELEYIDYEDSVKLTVIRGHELLELNLSPAEPKK